MGMLVGKFQRVYDGRVELMYLGACLRARYDDVALIYLHVLAFVPSVTHWVRGRVLRCKESCNVRLGFVWGPSPVLILVVCA